jgi:Fe-S cluster assembly protein SufD
VAQAFRPAVRQDESLRYNLNTGRLESLHASETDMTEVAEGTQMANFAADADRRGTTLGNGTGWAHELVRAGQARFAAVGFPKPKDEQWRFTNFNPITRTEFAASEPAEVSPDDAARFGMRDESAVELVFVNGFFSLPLSQLLSLPRGAKVGTLADAHRADVPALKQHLGRHATVELTPFAALNTAQLRDGAFVYLPRGTSLELPIHLLFLTTTPGAAPTVTHPRVRR